jgi:hypothetical protein
MQVGMITQTADRHSRDAADVQESESTLVVAALLFAEAHWQRQRNGVAEVPMGKRASL